MSRHPSPGRHELGQNFLADRRLAGRIVECVASTHGPIVEIGPGDGALTLPLARLGRPVTAVELDRRRAARLDARTPATVAVACADILRFPLPAEPHVVVGNIPFHLTTAILRRLLAATAWTDAVILVQWEVARRRAGVGGATMMTASWWPWYRFDLLERVPARAFRPVPAVDGGLLGIARRPRPLVRDRAGYQRMVRQVFTGRGRGLPDILRRTGRLPAGDLARWVADNGVTGRTLPKDLTATQWASLWARSGGDGAGAARSGARAPARPPGSPRSGGRRPGPGGRQ